MDAVRFDSLAKSAGRSSSRRQLFKLLGAAAAVWSAGRHFRSAAALPNNGTQHHFVTQCKDNGGEPSRVRTYVVECTYVCQFYQVCDFNFSPPSCYDVLLNC